jgi:hypothetical protein
LDTTEKFTGGGERQIEIHRVSSNCLLEYVICEDLGLAILPEVAVTEPFTGGRKVVHWDKACTAEVF